MTKQQGWLLIGWVIINIIIHIDNNTPQLVKFLLFLTAFGCFIAGLLKED